MEKACDLCHITFTVVGDPNAINPGGVRIGEEGGDEDGVRGGRV